MVFYEKSSSDEDESGPDLPTEEVLEIPLQGTAHDGVMLAAVCLSCKEYLREHGKVATWIQFGLMALLQFFGTLIQVCVVFFLLVTTTQEAADPFRHGVETNTETLSMAIGGAQPVRVPDDDAAIQMCHRLTNLHYAHLLVQIMWCTKMMIEFTDAVWRCRTLLLMPLALRGVSVEPLTRMQGTKTYVDKMTHPLKWLAMTCVCIPQFVCAFFLWWTGAKFLFFATSMGVLIMKAISLSFITQLDEMLFSAFAPIRFRQFLKKAVYTYTSAEPSWHWGLWGSSAAKVAFVAFQVYLVTNIIFFNTTRFRELCFDYYKFFPDQVSVKGGGDLWNLFLRSMELD